MDGSGNGWMDTYIGTYIDVWIKNVWADRLKKMINNT